MGNTAIDPTSRAREHLALARSYASAARSLCSAGLAVADCRPIYALVAHGFELAFKGCLIAHQWEEDRLMLVGHDLDRCWDYVGRLDVAQFHALGPNVDEVVRALSTPHLLSAFRYPQSLDRDLPDPSVAVANLKDVICAVDEARITPSFRKTPDAVRRVIHDSSDSKIQES